MIRLHRLVAPVAQFSQGSTPRAAQVSTGSSTTRVPAGRSSQSSRSSPTTSWPGTNGSDTSGGEVEAGLARQRAEVGAADAGQPGADPGPARAVGLGRLDGDQPQRRGVAGQQAGHPGPHRLAGHRARQGPEHLEGEHHRRHHLPRRVQAAGGAGGAGPVGDVPVRAAGVAVERDVRPDRDRVADGLEQRQVRVRVGVAVGRLHVDVVLRGVRPHPGGPGLPDER